MTPIKQAEKYQDNLPLLGCRLFFLKIYLYIKLICRTVVMHPLFETISICIIIVNSITLAYEHPVEGQQIQFFKLIEEYFIWIYTIEMMFKIIGYGLIFEKDAYLKSSWNILDFIIVITSWLPTGEGSNETL